MKITIAHHKTQAEAVAASDRAVDDVLKAIQNSPLEVTDVRKAWAANVCDFGLTAKWGFLKNPVTGCVDVSDHDITIDVDLGMLTKLIPENSVREKIEGRVKALLA